MTVLSGQCSVDIALLNIQRVDSRYYDLEQNFSFKNIEFPTL